MKLNRVWNMDGQQDAWRFENSMVPDQLMGSPDMQRRRGDLLSEKIKSNAFEEKGYTIKVR